MSMTLMAWLGRVEDEIQHSEFRVLFRLCWHCNEQDLLCCPSIDELVRGAAMSKSSVLRSLKELEKRAFITVERDRWANGTQKNNRYTILADLVFTLPDGRKIDLRPTPEQLALRVSPATPGEISRVSDQPGVTHDTSRVSIVTPNEQGSINKEESPLFLTEEAPSLDLMDQSQIPPPLTDYVLEGWKRLVEDHPRIQGIRVLNESRKKKIAARAREISSQSTLTAHQVWDQMFLAIRGSDFLCGRAPPGRNYSAPFTLSLDKILEPARFIQTLERASIDAEHNRATSDPTTGRRFGPAEQAGREAMRRYFADLK